MAVNDWGSGCGLRANRYGGSTCALFNVTALTSARKGNMDSFSPEKRSEVMSRIRSKDTKPEFVVRRLLHRLGYRFRLHRRDLPGKPDIVLPKWNTVIFVHGCFWHGHDCPRGVTPTSNVAYWTEKLRKNRDRDSRERAALEATGWRILIIWECELKNLEALADKLQGIANGNARQTANGC